MQAQRQRQILEFPKRMGSDETPEQKKGWKWDPSRHGNLAQLLFPLIGIIVSVVLTLWLNSNARESKAADDHTDNLILAKLDPAVKTINESIDNKLAPINKKLDDLASKVDDAQGQLKRLKGDMSEQARQQQQILAINRIQDPKRIFTTIRAEIQMAESSKRILPNSQLLDYKNAIDALPSSASEYWTTIAAIINYQSLVNQLNGDAPDPIEVSTPCITGTHNGFMGQKFSKCIIDLDTNLFARTVFEDSVIRYHGGSVGLQNVLFVNCRFIVDIPPQAAPPQQPELLRALLDSLDQKVIRISR